MTGIPPILEFDDDKEAILNPSGYSLANPGYKKAVACFFGDVLEILERRGNLIPTGTLGSEMGRIPVYHTIDTQSQVLAYLAGQGAPFSVQLLEKMIAAGIKKLLL